MINAVVRFFICGVAILYTLQLKGQAVIPLYEDEIPNSRPVSNQEYAHIEPGNILIVSKVSVPTLSAYIVPKEKATGAAVIICPGGGYTNLAIGYEGTEVAQRFNASGISAFVLKYRIPTDSTMIHKELGPLEDAQRALLIVRSRSSEWGIDPGRIGMMGFSAGGHLASTAGTHFEKNQIANPDHISLRPDFLVLIYPVISFNPAIAHLGSEHNLLGPDPSEEKIKQFSNELQVTERTPPAFLVHAKDDQVVPYQNSMVFAEALRKNHVQVEVYLYEKGGHGFGMTNKTDNKAWMDLLIDWLGKEQIIRHP